MSYEHKIKPFDHQLEHFEEHRESESWGLLWEQGTAKTKPVIDTAAWLYENGDIDGLLVVAPPGVERNWRSDELPKHCPDSVLAESQIMVWQTAKKSAKWHQREFDKLISHSGLAILLISYQAFMTKEGKNDIWKFLRRRRCLYILDESHNIKAPGAKRTISIGASGKYAPYRRILTGTPIAQGPFDVYSQIKFLDNEFWKDRGIPTYFVFKHRYGEWLTAAQVKEQAGYDPGYDKLIRYKNLDELHGYLNEISNRVLKDDVLDLPPKLFSKRYFEMDREQEKLYNQLKSEFVAELNGEEVDGELAIVRLLRLQQITCGYVKTVQEDEEGEPQPIRMIGNRNSRLECLREITDQTEGSGIIWARFTMDVDQIMAMLGDSAVRYDGRVSGDDCEIAKKRFQDGEVKWFVGTQAKGGPGLTLHRAKTVIYYSNSFKLVDRLQSEDRAHRAGMDDNAVQYFDIICPDTIDDHIVENLRNKLDVASQITGDTLKEWL
jgi:SNF2 family DNA or RNA helicase